MNSDISLATFPTQFEDIQQLSDGRYIVADSDTSFYQTGRLDVNLQSSESVSNAIANPNLSQEVKNEIMSKHELAVQTGQELVCTVFSPELLTNKVARDLSIYSTYNGMRMRSDYIYTYGVSTGWEYLSTGSSTSNLADSIVNFLLLAGSASKVVNFVSAGKTVLDFFVDVFGTSYITGHRNDYLQMRLIYDDVKQWTYREYAYGTEDWRLGLCTQKVTITQVGVEQYYYNGSSGQTETSDVSVNTVFSSEHFDIPNPIAYQWISSPLTEWVEWQCAGKTFFF